MSRIIAVDFDGTLCEDRWPDIGVPNGELIQYLIRERKRGAKLILWTCRVGEDLEAALKWSMDWGIKFDAVNENLPEVVERFGGSESRKIFAHEYIDDRSVTKFKLPYRKRSTHDRQTRIVSREKQPLI